MHEWALAEAVIATATKIADEQELRKVTEVTIRIGELQQIEPEIFSFALSQLKPARFGKTKFTIKPAKAKLKCRACGEQWHFTKAKLDENTREAIHFVPELAHAFIKCPRCGSPDFEIVEGRGVWLESVKGMK